MVNVAINGFGRIGRFVLRAGFYDKKINFVAVNDLTDAPTLAHLLEFDSVHGRFPEKVRAEGSNLVVGKRRIKVLAEKDPLKLPWKELKIDVVVESTGRFTTKEDAEQHLKAGAKKVIVSAPCKGTKPVKTIVIGVNDKIYDRKKDNIISTASCTTNCLAPVAKVLEDNFGIVSGFLTTIHAYTADQNIVDGPHKDLRRARAAAINIVPTSTGAAKAMSEVIPSLKGKMDGIAMRVPVANGSISDFVAVLKKKATVEQINKAMKAAANGKLKGILEYSDEPLVSTDIIGNKASSIFDSKLTFVCGNLVKVVAWYDNEWGYSNRMVDMIKKMVYF